MRQNNQHDQICYNVLVKFIKLPVKAVARCVPEALPDSLDIVFDQLTVGSTN